MPEARAVGERDGERGLAGRREPREDDEPGCRARQANRSASASRRARVVDAPRRDPPTAPARTSATFARTSAR